MAKKENKIRLGEDGFYSAKDNIIYVTIVGQIDDVKSTKLQEILEKFLKRVKKKVNVLIDTNNIKDASSNARKEFQSAITNEKIGKIAFFGLNPVAKVIASFVMGISKRKNMRFFNSKEKALNWLNF